MRLSPPEEHPHGLSQTAFDALFTKDKPVLFNFHAYPQLLEKLVFDRTNHKFKVKGYCEEGTITTPFDVCVLNGIDRFHLVMDVCDMIETECTTVTDETKWSASHVRQEMNELLIKHKKFIVENGVDIDEVAEWKWVKPQN
jgi:xylulose-5-phosphate/fructose-6-phosphate phosphoketolase